MARVDYYDLEVGLKEALQDDSNLGDINIGIEQEVVAEPKDTVLIYLEGRSAPADLQTLAAGTSTRFLVELSVWCYAYSIESVEIAARRRDDLVGKVELALMRKRDLFNRVNALWLDGGDFDTANIAGETPGFMSGAEIKVVVDVKAST